MISNNGGDTQQLHGCIQEEEEFLVKIEPNDDDYDEEVTTDPLYEPDSSEIDDDDDLAPNSVYKTGYPPTYGTRKDDNICISDISQSGGF